MRLIVIIYFMWDFLCLFCWQVTWRNERRSIAQLNRMRRISLTRRGTWWNLIRRWFGLKRFNLSRWSEVITVEIKCAWLTCGIIAIVRWRLNRHHQTTPLLHAWHGKIWTLHRGSDGHYLKMSIRHTTFNLSRRSNRIEASDDYAQIFL